MNLEKLAEAVGASVTQKLSVVRKALSHIAGEIKSHAVRLTALEARLPERGDPGRDGKDADPINLHDVIAELAIAPEIKTLLTLLVAEAVQEGIAKHFAANPVRDGKDGRDGVNGKDGAVGERGEKGDAGAPGKDGAGLADALIDRDGSLVLTMTDGRAKTLGVIVGRDGKDGTAGANGRDGLSLEDFSLAYDGEAHEVMIRCAAAGKAHELRYPAGGIRPGGFWREGMKCLAAQAVTHDGALWFAKRDTAAKPCLENADDWQLAARKGRDGRDGKDGKPTPGPVKLGGDGNA